MSKTLSDLPMDLHRLILSHDEEKIQLKKENEKLKTRVNMLQCLLDEARQDNNSDSDSDEDTDEDTDDGEYCDWCAAKTKPSDYDLSGNGNIFYCLGNDCDTVLCGRRGCSQNVAYYVCCKECEEDERQIWRDFYKTTLSRIY